MSVGDLHLEGRQGNSGERILLDRTKIHQTMIVIHHPSNRGHRGLPSSYTGRKGDDSL